MNLNATILCQGISFILLVIFCMKYIWPPIMEAIDKRQKDIADALASAEQAKKDLNVALTEANELLKKAKLEAKATIDHANKRYLQILNEAKAKAKQEHVRIITQARNEITIEIKRVKEELRKEIASLVVAGVDKIIKSSVDKTKSNNIIEEFFSKL